MKESKMKKRKFAKKHKWSEKDEKALLETVECANKLDAHVVTMLDGMWPHISGAFFAKTTIALSPDACRHRFRDIKEREKKEADAIVLNGTDFLQVKGMSDTDRITRLETAMSDMTSQVSDLQNHMPAALPLTTLVKAGVSV